jgi:hypothetical protein
MGVHAPFIPIFLAEVYALTAFTALTATILKFKGRAFEKKA